MPTETVTLTPNAPTTSAPEPTTAPPQTTAVPSPTTSPAVEPTSAESDTPLSWLWWLLAAIILALAIGIPLLLRARRRRAWQDEFASAEHEVEWFARTLIPDLRRLSSPAEVVGGWNIAESRVVAAEDRLTGLEPTAPDDETRNRVTVLRDAVRAARERMGQAGTPEQLDAIAADLERVLQPPPPPPPPTTPPPTTQPPTTPPPAAGG